MDAHARLKESFNPSRMVINPPGNPKAAAANNANATSNDAVVRLMLYSSMITGSTGETVKTLSPIHRWAAKINPAIKYR
jgi:hypothetical protein